MRKWPTCIPTKVLVCMLVIVWQQPHAMVISQLTVPITTMKLKVEENYFCISTIKFWNSLPIGIRSSSSIKSH